MLSAKQAENFKMDCAEWLEKFLKSQIALPINAVYTEGKKSDFQRRK